GRAAYSEWGSSREYTVSRSSAGRRPRGRGGDQSEERFDEPFRDDRRPAAELEVTAMDVIHARCAGLDVHKQTVVACVRVATAGPARHEVRTFATPAAGLLALTATPRDVTPAPSVLADRGVRATITGAHGTSGPTR